MYSIICITLFVYKYENLHIKVREEKSYYIEINKSQFSHLEIENEIGITNIEDYIKYIKTAK